MIFGDEVFCVVVWCVEEMFDYFQVVVEDMIVFMMYLVFGQYCGLSRSIQFGCILGLVFFVVLMMGQYIDDFLDEFGLDV